MSVCVINNVAISQTVKHTFFFFFFVCGPLNWRRTLKGAKCLEYVTFKQAIIEGCEAGFLMDACLKGADDKFASPSC